jgi:hypothetical protein
MDPIVGALTSRSPLADVVRLNSLDRSEDQNQQHTEAAASNLKAAVLFASYRNTLVVPGCYKSWLIPLLSFLLWI